LVEGAIAMQMAHLVLADLLWISLVIVATYSLRAEVVRVESSADLPVSKERGSRGRDLISSTSR